MSDSASSPATDGHTAPPAWVQAKARWRKFVAEQANSGAPSDLHIGLAASFTVHNLVQFVGAALIADGYRPQIAVGPYNQLFQVCLDPKAHFGEKCDAAVLLWRMEELLFDEIDGAIGQDKDFWPRTIEKLDALVAAVSNLRSAFSGTIIVSVPPLPARLAIGPLALGNPTGLGAFHRSVVDHFIAKVTTLADVRLLDLDAIQRQVGFDASSDLRQWYLYKQPFSDAFLHCAGAQVGRLVRAARQSAKKCVVLDCDNTLWGGIIGEDGLDGIELGDDYPGSAFRDFQRVLLNWRRQGIFLAILSRNNEADVWEVFERHGAMVLKRTDISAWQINWLPKAENLLRIAKKLNISVDSLVFIDDDPMEIAYMQQVHPQVTSILLPKDPAELPTVLQGLTVFDRLETTAEDLARVDAMRAETDREQVSARMTREEFLQALQLKLDLSIAGADDLNRVTQLINKTNQFNLTTVRRTLEEVRSLASLSDHRIYSLRVRDKFGDYGLTGVAIVQVSPDRTRWTIESLLLSCRVLGRGVESALLAILADDARAQGVNEFVASFLPTAKNSLAANFLPDHGFEPDGPHWRLTVANAPDLPAFVERVRAGPNPAEKAA
jgi:FkbH-like protein